jgi:CheY-like chemotaxis protein
MTADDDRVRPPVPSRRAALAHLRHELGTPLNAIIGYSEMLLEDAGDGVGRAVEADLELAHETGRRLFSLVRDVLDPAKVDAGLLDMPIEDVGAVIRHRLRTPLDVVVACSERLVEKAGSSGPPSLSQDLGRIRSATLQLRALVDDLGKGGATAAVDGDVTVGSAAPSDLSLQGLLRPAPGSRPAPDAHSPRSDLLVVDDNETNRDILSRILERRGHRLTAAASGQEALAALASRRFDLALLDIVMPEMNGFELLRRMKADESMREVPAIFISALDDAQGKVQAFRAGGVDYVTKPFQAEEVVARVENQLEIAWLQRDLARRNQELERTNEELVRAHQRTDLVFSALADTLPGTVLDEKYRLDEKIGSGGFGAVFRGTHLGLDSPVAIKVFHPIVGNDTPDALERFRQEGIAASRIKHPNVVEVLDNGISATGIAYLVMELMQGQTLEAELRAGSPLTPRRAAEILVPVCDALAEFHAAGIVHRDISPDNIYLHQGRKGEIVKLLDFGLSKITHPPSDQTCMALTITGSIPGTPAYMAPERFTSGQCDGRSDVYSLGVIMFRMLGGKHPFDPGEGGAYALAMMHLTSSPPPLRQLAPEIPIELVDLAHRAMSKDPGERPTAGELGDALRQYA